MTVTPQRLFAILDILQSRSIVSAAELTTRLEIEPRSLRRSLVQLQALGIPIESVRGRYGGYRLRPGATMPPLMLSEDEAQIVTLGLLLMRHMVGAAWEEVVARTGQKLRRVYPKALQEQAYALEAAISLSIPSDSLMLPRWLLILSQAAYRRQQLQLLYDDRNEVATTRPFDCYGVLAHEGHWYAVGYCGLRQAIRVFRVDRIRSAAWRDASFQPPADFDCRAYILERFAAIPDAWDIRIVVDGPLDTLIPYIPPGFATIEMRGSQVVIHARVRDLADTARWLVSIPHQIREIEPSELRRALARLALSLYDIAAGNAGQPTLTV